MKTFGKNIIKVYFLLSLFLVASCNEIPGDLFSEPPVDIKHVNGHGFVDLGLPSKVMWARCNVGAVVPEGYGDLFDWGETMAKTDTLTNNTLEFSDISGEPEYDVARLKWGDEWRMPTENEFTELMKYCSFKSVNHNGAKGYIVKSNKNGNEIFLPLSGYKEGLLVTSKDTLGCYWTSVAGGEEEAYCFIPSNNNSRIETKKKSVGLAVRPVINFETTSTSKAYLHLTPNTLEFSADSSTESVTVESNVSWYMECSSDWVKMEKDSKYDLKVTVLENEDSSSRSAKIIFKNFSNDKILAKLVVTQDGK